MFAVMAVVINYLYATLWVDGVLSGARTALEEGVREGGRERWEMGSFTSSGACAVGCHPED